MPKTAARNSSVQLTRAIAKYTEAVKSGDKGKAHLLAHLVAYQLARVCEDVSPAHRPVLCADAIRALGTAADEMSSASAEVHWQRDQDFLYSYAHLVDIPPAPDLNAAAIASLAMMPLAYSLPALQMTLGAQELSDVLSATRELTNDVISQPQVRRHVTDLLRHTEIVVTEDGSRAFSLARDIDDARDEHQKAYYAYLLSGVASSTYIDTLTSTIALPWLPHDAGESSVMADLVARSSASPEKIIHRIDNSGQYTSATVMLHGVVQNMINLAWTAGEERLIAAAIQDELEFTQNEFEAEQMTHVHGYHAIRLFQSAFEIGKHRLAVTLQAKRTLCSFSDNLASLVAVRGAGAALAPAALDWPPGFVNAYKEVVSDMLCWHFPFVATGGDYILPRAAVEVLLSVRHSLTNYNLSPAVRRALARQTAKVMEHIQVTGSDEHIMASLAAAAILTHDVLLELEQQCADEGILKDVAHASGHVDELLADVASGEGARAVLLQLLDLHSIARNDGAVEYVAKQSAKLVAGIRFPHLERVMQHLIATGRASRLLAYVESLPASQRAQLHEALGVTKGDGISAVLSSPDGLPHRIPPEGAQNLLTYLWDYVQQPPGAWGVSPARVREVYDRLVQDAPPHAAKLVSRTILDAIEQAERAGVLGNPAGQREKSKREKTGRADRKPTRGGERHPVGGEHTCPPVMLDLLA